MKIKKILEELQNKKVNLVAVTKNQNIETINEVISQGIKTIGENRLQAALKKIPSLSPVEKHFIGRLQTNKIKKIVENFDMIQSVDKGKYLLEINKQAEKHQKIMPVLIQVNISGEEQKGGILPTKIMDFMASAAHLKNIQIFGLMGIASETDDESLIRKQFSLLKNLFDEIKKYQLPNVEMKYLSMGMSQDFKIAIGEGSNMVRIGRKLFA